MRTDQRVGGRLSTADETFVRAWLNLGQVPGRNGLAYAAAHPDMASEVSAARLSTRGTQKLARPAIRARIAQLTGERFAEVKAASLTANEVEFAGCRAAGMSAPDAYRAAYPRRSGLSPYTDKINGAKIEARPRVAAYIAELLANGNGAGAALPAAEPMAPTHGLAPADVSEPLGHAPTELLPAPSVGAAHEQGPAVSAERVETLATLAMLEAVIGNPKAPQGGRDVASRQLVRELTRWSGEPEGGR